MSNIQKLEQTLAERLAELELQRVAENADFERRKLERENAIAAAKESQKREYDAKVAARLAREAEERERYLAFEKVEKEKQAAIDQENTRIEEERRKEAERVKSLQDKLSQIEYAEEQRRKAMEAALPVFIDQGEITEGVHGLEPETPLMSEHLRKLLKQNDRDY
jgi:hypothetical protein